MRNSLLFILGIVLFSACGKQGNWELQSPDGKIETHIKYIEIEGFTHLKYTATIEDARGAYQVLEESDLGIVRSDADFSRDLHIIEVSSPETRIEEYQLFTGKRLKNVVEYNERVFKVESDNGKPMNIRFRVYNDGIAFRYEFPESDETVYEILAETSNFNLPDEGEAWIQPYDTLNTWSPAYEYGYIKDLKIGDEPPLTTGWGFPALFYTNDCWILLTETDVDTSYCGSHLASESSRGVYKIEFPHDWESFGLYDRTPKSTLPWKTPWRIAIMGRNLGTIVESNLALTLASPNRLEYTDWIEPGLASWSWWSDHESGKDFVKLKEYVDFTARMGWPYTLVDADWHIMEGGTLEELVEYAKSKNVGIWIWYNSGGPHTKVMNAGPRDLIHIPEVRQKEFERISDMGVVGIKVDFFQSDKQEIINLYHGIFKDAAYYDLLVNTHGCTLPRGWTRTYPNVLGVEAVRGAELYGWEGFPPQALWLNSVYPFTRNVVGSMDYTPVTFSDYLDQVIHITTNAHELALSVIFECGIQHIADKYQSIESQPDYVINFLKNVPVTWDDIHFIDGYPGKLAIIARKQGDEYYIAGINSELIKKDIGFIPTFLPEGEYKFEIIKDGKTNRSFEQKSMILTNKTEFTLSLPEGGGFVGIARMK